MKRFKGWGIASGMAVVSGCLLLLWRWQIAGVSSLDIGMGLLVLGGVSTILWVTSHVPVHSSSHKRPMAFWMGLTMILVGTISVSLLSIPVKPSPSGSRSLGYRVYSGGGPPIVAKHHPPVSAQTALSQVFPGTRIDYSFVATGPVPVWEFLIARGSRLVAEATWNGNTLTFVNLGWNLYMNRQPMPKHHYSWNQLRSEVQVPPHATVLGPYHLPGYDVMVVPNRGQLWDLNVLSGEAGGSGV